MRPGSHRGSAALLALWIGAWFAADVVHRMHHAADAARGCGSAACAHAAPADESAPEPATSHDARHCGLCRFAMLPLLLAPPAPEPPAPQPCRERPPARPVLRAAVADARLLPPARGPPAAA